MDQYTYLIAVLLLFAILALVAILRYRKSKMSIKAPGVSLDVEGESDAEQSQQAQQGKAPSAKTKVGGKLSGSTVVTSAGGGEAETDVEGDVDKSDILTEA